MKKAKPSYQSLPFPISISEEHAPHVKEIEECFADINLDISASIKRFSAEGLALAVAFPIGYWIAAHLLDDIDQFFWDTFKAGVKNLFKRFRKIGVTAEADVVFIISADGKVRAQDREKEFAHIKDLNDLINHLTKKKNAGWSETTLGENLLDIAMGPFGSDLKVEMFVDQGVPIIRGGNLKGDFVAGDFVYVSELKADSLKRAIAYPGDIIVTHRGTLGQVSMVPNNKFKRYVTSQSQLRFKVDQKKVSNKYLLYFLKSRIGQYELLKNASQVGVPAISKPTKAIKDINLLLPSVSEQTAIADVLISLDSKIDLLQEQNKTLEAIAQSLFKEWFVDFNFPNEQGKPYQKNSGAMINSEFGKIPTGWRVGKLSEEFTITMGQSPSGSSYNDQGEGMIFFQGRAEFQDRFPKVRLYTTQPKRTANQFDVLVSVRAPVGSINLAGEKCCIGRGLAAVSSKFKSYALYKVQSLSDTFDKFDTEGTVFGSINKSSFENINVIIPKTTLVESFEKIVSSIDAKFYHNYLQMGSLSTLRDLILPRLICGEMRVLP